jgi:hypothetical protein
MLTCGYLVFKPWQTILRRQLRRLQCLIQPERGVTIPEMLIALFLAAMTAGLVGTAVYQFFSVTIDGNNRLALLHDLENASMWIGKDVSEARSFMPGSGTVYGILTTGDASVQYRYYYDPGMKALVRQDLVDDLAVSTRIIARRIAAQEDVVFSLTNNLLTVSITSSSNDGTISESTTLHFYMRVD